MSENTQKTKRGFAVLDPDLHRAIASRGGKRAHELGTAHKFTSEQAARAGKKGGASAHRQGLAHEFTPEEARVAGRKGGEAVSQNRAHMAAIARKGVLVRRQKKADAHKNA